MCLITTPRRSDRTTVRRGYDYDAPRPVSNYQGGPHYAHVHHHHRPSRQPDYSRRSVSRTRIVETEPRRSGRSVDYVRTTRGSYVR